MNGSPDSGVRAIGVTSRLLDRAAAERLRDELRDAAARGARALVVDLGAVEAFDPIGLSVLAMARRELPEGLRMAIAALRPPGQAAVMAMRLHEVFEFYADVPAATADLAG